MDAGQYSIAHDNSVRGKQMTKESFLELAALAYDANGGMVENQKKKNGKVCVMFSLLGHIGSVEVDIYPFGYAPSIDLEDIKKSRKTYSLYNFSDFDEYKEVSDALMDAIKIREATDDQSV